MSQPPFDPLTPDDPTLHTQHPTPTSPPTPLLGKERGTIHGSTNTEHRIPNTQSPSTRPPLHPSTRHFVRAVQAVFVRECLSEARQWQGLNTVLMFGLMALLSVSLGLKGDRLDSPAAAGGLFWTVQFFTAMSALSRSFVREEDAGTSMALRLSAPPNAVYLGKLGFNLLLMLGLNLLLEPGFVLLINRPLQSPWLFTSVVIFGSIALAAASTILGAVAARAGSRTALFAVIAFPLMLPVLIPGIDATAIAFGGVHGPGQAVGDLRFIVSYGIISVISALMLFPVVWWA